MFLMVQLFNQVHPRILKLPCTRKKNAEIKEELETVTLCAHTQNKPRVHAGHPHVATSARKPAPWEVAQ